MQEFDTLKTLVVTAETELVETEKGNKVAGVRFRKVLQEIKKQAQVVREKVMELRKESNNTES